MRITIIHTEVVPPPTYGGTERIVYWLAKELARRGHHVTLLGGAGSSAPFEPMLARYDSPRVLPALRTSLASGVRSFQALFAAVEVELLVLEASEPDVIRDWDSPEDIL